ncbi:MAG TPA: HlyD family efflux transporter periplasmic adaptor subunit, partial [Anaerolineaceae bacterium]
MGFRQVLALVIGLSLAGCSALSGAKPTPLPTVVLAGASAVTPAGANPAATGQPAADNAAAASGAVTASAEIAPAQQVDLGFASIGVVGEVKVSEGDAVKAGEVLASLDNAAQLQAAVDAGQKALDSAQKSSADLAANQPVVRANAELTLAQAQKAFTDAQKAAQSKQFQRATQQTIDIARANLIVANKALDDAETIYNQNKNRNSTDVVYAAALSQLAAAQQRQQQAQSNFNYVSSLPDPTDIQIANANLDVAQANLDAANAAWAQVRDGAESQALLAAQAQVITAQAALAAAQVALDHAVIKAPFDGTVVSLSADPGQAVVLGQPVLTVANLQRLQVETTDLSERDVTRVSLGQPATISVTALGKDFPGKVTGIAGRATKVGGDV